jgi:hypothetical protein
MPRDKLQVRKFTTPDPGEDPFFCLLEDDSLVTKASVETDTLLEPVTGDPNDVRLVIRVNLRPLHVVPNNIGFS